VKDYLFLALGLAIVVLYPRFLKREQGRRRVPAGSLFGEDPSKPWRLVDRLLIGAWLAGMLCCVWLVVSYATFGLTLITGSALAVAILGWAALAVFAARRNRR